MIVKLCDAHHLPEPGCMKAFHGNGLEICLARPSSEPASLFAFNNRCPHQGAPLSAGVLSGTVVTCPYHAWRFNITSGAPEVAADPPLTIYEVRQYGSEVFVRIPGATS